ncbi:hypothetical protein GCM10009654_12830 [Streptomyces hebeiensis]|uniref:Uncharacterized protein n=1 Tax=Streptomyces hebeiensis TaxID=229486 RepID=A0ABN1UM81_9ACTN
MQQHECRAVPGALVVDPQAVHLDEPGVGLGLRPGTHNGYTVADMVVCQVEVAACHGHGGLERGDGSVGAPPRAGPREIGAAGPPKARDATKWRTTPPHRSTMHKPFPAAPPLPWEQAPSHHHPPTGKGPDSP